ncbi:MAG: NPCBM/NEW2 domain-containing protein, partial [Bacteroidota bacterium]|nr:NPCBM/NEW2 domain-containing protein [Bacteroidota bacterium]
METQSKILVLIWCLISFGSCSEKTSVIWLDDLKIKSFSEGIPAVLPKTNAAGDSMKINGIYFERGVGVQTISVLSFFLDGNARQFTAEVGADDKGNKDVPVKFYVIGDRKILFESNEMRVGDQTQKVNVNLKGIKRLGLLVTDDV